MENKNRQKLHVSDTNIKLPDYGILVESHIERPATANIAHRHNHPSILCIVSGQGFFEFDDKKFPVSADSIITLEKEKIHKLLDRPRKAMTVFSIYFDMTTAGLNKYIVDYLFSSAEPFTLPLYYSENIKRYLRQILHEQNTKPPGYKLSIKQNFSLAVLQIYRVILEQRKQKKPQKPPAGSERVKAVLDFIAQNCHEQYGLADAARLGKVSQRQFTNLCRNLTGSSFIKFLNSTRCQKAAQLLKQTDKSVAAIAFEVGYEELSTFYRAFKRIYKSSPMQLRTTPQINRN